MNLVKNTASVVIILASLAAGVPAQDKAASGGHQSLEVKFQGKGISLAGTIIVPHLEDGARVPGMLILPDSGNSSRDGVTFGKASHPIYRQLAEHFAGRGIAVLRYDKRCRGASECRKAETFDDYIDDARGALRFLRSHPSVVSTNIIVFGHGEGGLLASSIAAFDEEKFSGIVLAGMAGRTLGKVLRDQTIQRMTEDGKSQDEINKYLVKFDRTIRALMSGKMNFQKDTFDPSNPYDSVLKELADSYAVNMSLLINDPLQIVNTIDSPMLIVQGRKDLMVDVKDAQYLNEAMKRSYHEDVTLKLFDNVDHLLKTNPGVARLAIQADTSRDLDPKLMTYLTEWIELKIKSAKAVE